MARRKRSYDNDSGKLEASANLFLDITFLPIYRLCKIFVIKTPFKESFNAQRGYFIFDCICAGFLFYILYWIGSFKVFGHQWTFFWYFGGGLLGLIILCFFIGRWRRTPRYQNVTTQVIAEEKREQITKVPKVRFTQKPSMDSSYYEVLEALGKLGYNSHEQSLGAKYAESQVPDGTSEEKLVMALSYFNDKVRAT